MDARGDDGALQDVPISNHLPQQALRSPVGLDGRYQGMQLLAEAFIQAAVKLQHLAALLAQFEHLVLVAVIMLPQDAGGVAAQVQAGGQTLHGSGIDGERQDAAITLFQLVRQERDVVQQTGKTLVPLRQPLELRDELGADGDTRVGLTQEMEDARHALHIFRHNRRDQAMSLAGRTVAAIPVAPKRQKRSQIRVGQLPGIFLARDQGGQVEQDLIGFLL